MQKIWAQSAQISDPAERMAIAIRQFLHQAMRSILEGQMPPDHPEQIAKLLLKTLGVKEGKAEAIAFKALEPLPD